MAQNLNTDCNPVNPVLVEEISKDMISGEKIVRAASFFKVVGDETRMKILVALSQNELCVNDVAYLLDMTKSAVSHQLKLLNTEGLIKKRRCGKNIYYSLDDQHVVDLLAVAFKHIEHKMHESHD